LLIVAVDDAICSITACKSIIDIPAPMHQDDTVSAGPVAALALKFNLQAAQQ
jgi:hypothetical protein